MKTKTSHTAFGLLVALALPLSYCDAQTPGKAEAILTKPGECSPAAPKDPSLWDRSLIFGFNLTDGNSNTLLLNTKLSVKRDYEQNIWDFGISGRYGEQERTNTDEDTGSDVTQQDLKASATYKRLLSDRLYAGGGVDFLYDKIADIDYRVTLKVPVGYFVIREDDLKLAFEAGPGYVFEEVGEVENDYLAPFIGERFEWKLSDTAKIYQNAEVLFDVDDSDNYLVKADAGIEAALNSWLSLVVAVEDTYDNVPAEGKEENDLAFSTALKVAL
ncbi:MAG: DUF481 domain-containing protein [Bdellovibrionales bacterium]|nr:DUF481 domain-containing protein [Bdellovibrionales bacterium]